MTWISAQMALIDTAIGAMEFALNWLLQSSLLIGVGLATGRLLRHRGSAVQSVVYRTTLAGIFLCPLATWGLSQAGVSGWSFELPREWSQQQIMEEVVDITQNPSAPESEVFAPGSAAAELEAEVAIENSQNLSALVLSDNLVSTNASQPIEDPTLASGFSSAAELTEAELTESGSAELSPTLVGLMGLGIVTGWGVMSLVLATRLAIAHRRLVGIRMTAVAADEQAVDACQELSSTLGVSAPEVLRTPYLPSPCLAGLRKPAVLLPEVDHSLSLREVLIHELAHLRRHDCHWNLFRQIATSLFFFQPLLWKLSGRIETTAEEVCDDFVVQHGGDRQEYAHRLVDIAELSSAPIAAAGVGMVSLHSMLAKRIVRIMDTSRTLSTRAGNLLLALVLIGGLIGTAATGLVGLGPDQAQAENETSVSDEAKSIDRRNEKDANADIEEDEDVITVHGTVVGPEGEPAPGAEVFVLRWFWNFGERRPLATAKADNHGKFEIAYRKSQFFETGGRPDQWREAYIAAFADGTGAGWVLYGDLAADEEPQIQLAVDDVPIEGFAAQLKVSSLTSLEVSVDRGRNGGAGGAGMRRVNLLWLKLV